jgi:hypothetical protein
VIIKSPIVKFVKNNEIKLFFGFAHYVHADAHELLVNIIEKILVNRLSTICDINDVSKQQYGI